MGTRPFVVCLVAAAAGGAVLGLLLAPGTPPPSRAGTSEAEVMALQARLGEGAASPDAPSRGRRSYTSLSDEDLRQRDAEKDGRIRGLEAEVDRLTAALASPPEPEVPGDLHACTVEELLTLATNLRREAEGRLLTPPEGLADRFAAFLRRPSSGTARILTRGKYDHLVEKRGGGAYWSFVTQDNDYDKEPDLELQGERFHSGFYGNAEGWFLDLGTVDPDAVGASEATPPPGLEEAQAATWRHLWSESPFSGATKWQEAAGPLAEWKRAARALGIPTRVPATAEHTYLLRSMLPGEHDVLVLFHATMPDDAGLSLVWQVLRSWEVPRR